MNDIKQLFWRTSVNLTVKVISQFLNLALIPVYITYLKPDEYGIFNVSIVFLSFLMLFGVSGLSDSLLRFYAKARNPQTKKLIFSSILLTVTFLTITFILLILFFKGFLAELFFNNRELSDIINFILLAAILEAWNLIIIILLHGERKNIIYGIALISKNSVKLISTFLLLHYFDLNIYGALIGINLGALVLILICLPIVYSKITFHFSKKILRILINYGLPFILTGLSMNLLFQVDQLILKFIIGLEAVAVYGMSYKLGSAIQYFNTSFSLAWFPHLFKLDKKKAKESISIIFNYYLVVVFMLGSIITILNNIFLQPFLPQDYQTAIVIIPWIVWGYIIYGLSDFLAAGLFIRYKSQLFSTLSAFAALINIVLNIIFISIYGIQAAAIVTFISFIFLTSLSHFYAQRIFPVNFDIRKNFKIAIVFSVLIAAAFIQLSDSTLINACYGTFLLILSFSIPFIFRYISWQQLKNLFSPGKLLSLK